MGDITVKNIEQPDETRKFAGHGWLELVQLPGMTFGRAVFQPGWRWSKDIKPIAGTDSCLAAHNGFVLSGRMHVEMDGGRGADIGPGDAVTIEPGHDAWVLGDEDCVMLDFTGVKDYAKPKS